MGPENLSPRSTQGQKESPLTCRLSVAPETEDRLGGGPQDGSESSESASKSQLWTGRRRFF